MFSKMFGTKPNEQQQPPAVGAKDQIKPDGMSPSDPNAAGVADPNNPDSGKSQENPLDAFKDLYKVDPPKEGDTTPQPPKLELTDEVFAKVLPSLDFTSGLSPEVQQGLANGDSKAILAAIQQAGANAYKTAMQHNAAIMEDHLSKRFEAFKPEVKANVDRTITSQALSTLPNADNPVVKAELDRVASQLRTKYPAAPNEWIVQQTNTYLSELGKQLSPQQNTQQQQQQLPEQVDFAELLKADG